MFAKILSNLFPSLWKGALAAVAGGAVSIATPILQNHVHDALSLVGSLLVWGALGGVGIKPKGEQN